MKNKNYNIVKYIKIETLIFALYLMALGSALLTLKIFPTGNFDTMTIIYLSIFTVGIDTIYNFIQYDDKINYKI